MGPHRLVIEYQSDESARCDQQSVEACRVDYPGEVRDSMIRMARTLLYCSHFRLE